MGVPRISLDKYVYYQYHDINIYVYMYIYVCVCPDSIMFTSRPVVKPPNKTFIIFHSIHPSGVAKVHLHQSGGYALAELALRKKTVGSWKVLGG